jgi:NADPH-dependent stearoyl-CoA 9-desaturase
MKKLSEKQLSDLVADLHKIRDETLSTLGKRDAKYILDIRRLQIIFEISGRVSLMLCFIPIFWVIGVILLFISKALNNMELGHNVMHGQYDFMNHPHINSTKYEWEQLSYSDFWQYSHNFAHHTQTNLIGLDADIKFLVFRMKPDIKWKVRHLFQPLYFFVVSLLLFNPGVVLFDIKKSKKIRNIRPAVRKIRNHILKNYVLFPLLSAPLFIPVLLGNLTASILYNLWSSILIFCNHFTESTKFFTYDKNESKGEGYVRNILSSVNITGPSWFHILAGHLSFHIEHHLFPDMPSSRLKEIAPKVEAICKKYEIPYNKASLFSNYCSVIKQVFKCSFPTKNKQQPYYAQS